MTEIRWSTTVPGRGASIGDTEVVCVGFMPREAEVEARQPFAGPCGSVVREVLDAKLSGVFYTNVLHQMSTVDGAMVSPPKEAISTGVDRVCREVRLREPVVVVTIGAKVARLFIEAPIRLMRDHGQPIWSPTVDAYVVPLLDPAFVRRRGGLLSKVGEEWLQDIDVIRELVERQ
jgi:uracil-DNA glycosylase family 4